jgi:hypothetical protein
MFRYHAEKKSLADADDFEAVLRDHRERSYNRVVFSDAGADATEPW